MTLSLEVKTHKPPRILIYGPAGLGKSTFGALADSPVFIQTEDGLSAIDVPAFPLAKSYKEVMGYLGELCTKDHAFKTLVIDSVDWLEPLIWSQICSENNVPTIEKAGGGYGKGFTMALDLWREYIMALDYLRDHKNMTIIQIAHAQIKKFENPETESYDRYEIKLHKAAAAKLQEHSDIVLFVNYFVGVTKEDKAFSKDGRKRAVGAGERVLYTQERPAAVAKNRYGLPEEIPFDKNGTYWNVIAGCVPFYNQTQVKEKKHG